MVCWWPLSKKELTGSFLLLLFVPLAGSTSFVPGIKFAALASGNEIYTTKHPVYATSSQ